jgi:glutamine synthetase
VNEERDEGAAALVHLTFMDLLGLPKEVTIPTGRLDEALRAGVAFDGSALEGFVRTAEADMRLRPDPATRSRLMAGPGRERGGHERMVCDIVLPDGTPYDACPRSILRGRLRDLDAAGMALEVGAEVEFFLLPAGADAGTMGAPAEAAGYFDATRGSAGEAVRGEVVVALEAMGVRVEASHHEVAPAQHEIDLLATHPVALADGVATLRWLARVVAPMHGLRATFMPKPFSGLSGSGLHLALTLRAGEGGQGKAEAFAAGILAHAGALCAVANPVVNSYKRLVPGYEAPLYVTWARHHRSPLLRLVQDGRHERERGALRLEYRGPDSAANPYLLLAALIGCGLDGVERGLALPAAVEESPGRLPGEERRRRGIRRLPADLRAALDVLAADAVVTGALGERVAQRLIEARAIEWEIYQETVHTWEREQYLDAL